MCCTKIAKHLSMSFFFVVLWCLFLHYFFLFRQGIFLFSYEELILGYLSIRQMIFFSLFCCVGNVTDAYLIFFVTKVVFLGK
jgi:hypothetical protein